MAASVQHIHLDLLGGMAGDMFVAAVLDALPELRDGLLAALEIDDIATLGRLSVRESSSAGMAGLHVNVELSECEASRHVHRSYRDIRSLLATWPIDLDVCAKAEAIFLLLAESEAAVHGVEPDDVVFHEIGAVDSVIDIIATAWLIDALGSCTWSCSPIPLGAGRVKSQHGPLPVPAPATVRLLHGMPVFTDGIAGERVTPTGAALLRYLAPSFDGPTGVMTLGTTGHGVGTKSLDGIANLLRVLVFEHADAAPHDDVLCCTFEIDDQTPEDLAVALDNLRALHGVVDVVQMPAIGKHGRQCAHIQVLANPGRLEPVVETIFQETTTLGLRWQRVSRRTLPREQVKVAGAGAPVRVKRASRPGGMTAKAEMADLAGAPGGHEGRRAARADAESRARDGEDPTPTAKDGS